MSGDLPSAEVFYDAPGLAPRKGAIQEVSDACDRFLAERAGRPYGGLAQQITEHCKANTAKGLSEGKYEDNSEKKFSHPAETGQAAEITAKRDRLRRRGEEEDKNITDRKIEEKEEATK